MDNYDEFLEDALRGFTRELRDFHYSVELYVDSTGRPEVTVETSEKSMPDIQVRAALGEYGKWIFDATLTFPVLDTSEYDYYDSIAYVLGKWAKIGEAVSWLEQTAFDVSDYIEE